MKIGQAIRDGVTAVTKDWTTVKKKQIRDAARGARALERFYRGHVKEESIKAVAYRIMADAYQKASGGGRFAATARQVMYAARPLILAETDKPLGKDFDQYFTQNLLPGYQQLHPSQTAGWDVIYDARGHLYEPHTRKEIALGTLEVRNYLQSASNVALVQQPDYKPVSLNYPTTGPTHRYRAVLFLEKEGFLPLLQQAKIGKRFDLALMSTKGMASTAARQLMEVFRNGPAFAFSCCTISTRPVSRSARR